MQRVVSEGVALTMPWCCSMERMIRWNHLTISAWVSGRAVDRVLRAMTFCDCGSSASALSQRTMSRAANGSHRPARFGHSRTTVIVAPTWVRMGSPRTHGSSVVSAAVTPRSPATSSAASLEMAKWAEGFTPIARGRGGRRSSPVRPCLGSQPSDPRPRSEGEIHRPGRCRGPVSG